MVVGYLDASSGSMVVGAIAAAGAGVAVAAKVGWRRVAGAFGGKKGEVEADPAETAETSGAPDTLSTDVGAGTSDADA
jgi:hypothetical protein